ncbi:hypothetical protein PMIN06_012545 [Paraphaeosphaeria minitans]
MRQSARQPPRESMAADAAIVAYAFAYAYAYAYAYTSSHLFTYPSLLLRAPPPPWPLERRPCHGSARSSKPAHA